MPVFRIKVYKRITEVYTVQAEDEMQAEVLVLNGYIDPEDDDEDTGVEIYELDEEEAEGEYRLIIPNG